MTKKTLRQPPMFLDLDWCGACQPLSRNVCPTKRKRQQSQQFLQSLPLGQMCLFQTKAPRLQAPEQVLDLPAQGIVLKYLVSMRTACDNHVFALAGAHPHQGNLFAQDLSLSRKQEALSSTLCPKQIRGPDLFAAARCCDFQILTDAQAKRYLLSQQITKPVSANKFAVCRDKRKAIFTKQLQILLQEGDSLSSVATTFLLQDRPQQRKGHAFPDQTQHQDIQRSFAQVPIGAVNGNDEGRREAEQFNDQSGDLSKRQLEESQESLASLVMRIGFGSSAHHRRDLYQRDSLDLHHRDDELRQKVDSSFIPSYIFTKRSLQTANVGHCAGVLSRNVWRQILLRITAQWPFMQFQRSFFVLY